MVFSRVCKALLERHANVNLKDKKGRTAFSIAQSLTASGQPYDTFLRGRQAGIMKILYQAGAKE